MKNMLFFTLFLVLHLASNASEHDYRDTIPVKEQPISAESYNAKAKRLNTAGIILLTTGTVMLGTGVMLAISTLDHLFEPGVPPNDYGSWPEILGWGGLILIGSSIPLLIAGDKNKKRAKLLVGTKHVPGTYSAAGIKKQVFAGVTINF